MFFLLVGTSDAREWRNAEGKAIEAEILGLEQGSVIVQMPNKARAFLPLEKLSVTDQEWMRDWAKGKTAAQCMAPPLWPETVQQQEIHVKQLPQEGKNFFFRSPHYEFACDDAVSVSVMNDFATVAEGTVRLLEALPLHFPKSDGKTFYARIYSNRAGYERAGGPKGSAGVYMTANMRGDGVLLVPFASLGIEQFGGKNTKGYDYSATVLIHEMVHQATGAVLPLMPRWLAEGLAEYGANMTYRNGVFYFTERDRLQALHKRLDYYENVNRMAIAKNPGAVNRLPASWIMRPSDLLKKGDEAWNTAAKGRDAQIQIHRLYLSSMFLMYYYLHFADGGDARRIRVYFDELAQASRYINTDGREGHVPAGLVNDKRLTLIDVQKALVVPLIGNDAAATLDADFHKRFTALGFRIGD